MPADPGSRTAPPRGRSGANGSRRALLLPVGAESFPGRDLCVPIPDLGRLWGRFDAQRRPVRRWKGGVICRPLGGLLRNPYRQAA